MVIELPNLGSNFPNLPPLQPIPIVQYLSMSQERKERLKGFPNFPEHPTRQDKEPSQGQIQLSLLVQHCQQQPLTEPTAHTPHNKGHLSCINLQEPDISVLHKIHTTKGHNFPGERSDYAARGRCEGSEPTQQQETSHHSRFCSAESITSSVRH